MSVAFPLGTPHSLFFAAGRGRHPVIHIFIKAVRDVKIRGDKEGYVPHYFGK